MGIGLWFSQAAAAEVLEDNRGGELRDWLARQNLIPFTLNAFPQFNFHQRVVKHQVYSPDWAHEQRGAYTLACARLLDAILPTGLEGSLSTLPLGWARRGDQAFQQACCRNLATIVRWLADLEQRTGRCLYLCLEPEPGCTLTTSDDVAEFFERYVWSSIGEIARRHLRICHDVCHSAVMFEPQAAVVERYRQLGVRIGKVQISSAVETRLPADDVEGNRQRIAALARFDEPRYLHQTTRWDPDSGQVTFYEDLPSALAAPLDGIIRVHFHVPIFLESLPPLQTTQNQIGELLTALAGLPADQRPRHFEVETYAWNVLPPSLQVGDLAEGIAKELVWLQGSIANWHRSI
jgi:hypothetical protein